MCGDVVHCEPPDHLPDANSSAEQPHSHTLRITHVEPRTSVLQRTDRHGQAKPIAANLSQLVAVTASKPPFDPLLLDRYTIAARHMGVTMVIVINKVDLLDTPELQHQADSLQALYRAIGYTVLRCNSKTGEGFDDLSAQLRHQVSILVGQSGVGKSSILNNLLPDQSIKTGTLSESSGLGRHTTTVTTWYSLTGGGAIIDSAGVRQFALEHLSDVDIESGFLEIARAARHCKFRNCRHIHEPDCAVLAALNSEQISRQRYENFLTISAQSSPT